jgi:uncharacterized protein (TIGR03437 family)
VFGHARNIATSSNPLAIDTNAPNLVEGRELFAPQGIALDTSANPPILYVSDTGNNRVLAWRNSTGFEVGAPADLVIGQRDRFSTLPLGPATPFSTGLTAPTGLLVDRSGNLFVVDSGNNRVLRYPPPFGQPADAVNPATVIGQPRFDSNTANIDGISEKTLAFRLGNSAPLRVGISFDNDGNLWVTDPGNQRILRYPAASLAQNQPAADLVLGQQSFVGRTGTTDRLDKQLVNQPSAVTVDQGGRLFVTDLNNRVLVFEPPFTNGKPAARIMGIHTQVQGQPAPVLSQFTLGARSGSQNFPPEGVFMIGNRPAVVDTPFHRILVYDPYPDWPAESVSFSPPARTVVGQQDFNSGLRHRGGNQPTGSSFLAPTSAVASATEMFVADTANHRVLVLPGSGATYGPAVRLLGQVGFSLTSVNLIEGRELYSPMAVAVDTTVRPYRLYVADSANNRVLGYNDYLNYKTGQPASIVIGQPNFFSAVVNHPSNDAALPTDTGLNVPQALAVDSAGNLWVADSGNGRVLRFPKPFEQPDSPARRADLVLGQSSFTSQVRDPGARTMRSPSGIAFSLDGSNVNDDRGVLVVVDNAHHRALVFSKPFTSGMAASRVFGQPDFTSSSAGADNNRMNSPRHAAVDTDDRLYIADTLNQRVLIFNNVTLQADQPIPAVVLRNTTGSGRLNRPFSVTVSPNTGEIWVAENVGNAVYRYPRFDQLPTSNFQANFGFTLAGPLGVTLDPFSNLLVADSYHRVGYFVPEMVVTNAATGHIQAMAPGTIISIYPSSPGNFGSDTATRNFNELPQPIPLPQNLSDMQVLIRTNPLAEPEAMPLFFVSAQQINAPLSLRLPESGRAELQVVRPSTGQIFGVAELLMHSAAPGFFTIGSTGIGQIAALNEDGSVNSAQNPIARGQVIQMFGTGQGVVPNAPADGELTPGALPSRDQPRVIINSREVTPEYSGLAPGLIGVWQINVRIPDFVPPSDAIDVVVLQSSVPSNLRVDPSTNRPIRTTIAVKQ